MIKQTYTTGQASVSIDQTPIAGYRELNQQEITAINVAKALGSRLGDFIATLETDPDIDKLWLAIAKTDLQKGIMFLVRSIAKPESF